MNKIHEKVNGKKNYFHQKLWHMGMPFWDKKFRWKRTLNGTEGIKVKPRFSSRVSHHMEGFSGQVERTSLSLVGPFPEYGAAQIKDNKNTTQSINQRVFNSPAILNILWENSNLLACHRGVKSNCIRVNRVTLRPTYPIATNPSEPFPNCYLILELQSIPQGWGVERRILDSINYWPL